MKLESKLGISTGGIIFAMFVSAFMAQVLGSRAMRMSNHIGDQHMPFIMKFHNISNHIRDSLVDLESSILYGGKSTAAQTLDPDNSQPEKLIGADLAMLRNDSNRPDLGADESKFNEMLSQIEEMQVQEQQVQTSIDQGTAAGTQKAREQLESNVLPLAASIFRLGNQIAGAQEAVGISEFKEMQNANAYVIGTLWTATILGALIGGLLSFLLARRITRGIRLVAARANAIASGDLTGAELDIHSSDQIGSLARAMQQMQNSLGSIIGAVVHNAGSLTASAGSMSSATDQIHRRVDQQAQQTQQAATAMQEMSASIAEVSRHTQSAAETARSAAQTAHEGDAIVKQMLASMHSIATAVNDTSSAIGLLGEDSRRISQIVTVIDEIARKTNLLALTAAIEAARAGEQGRGFAVVAGEVRHLAESTAQATGEISAMIQGIQNRTRTAIASMTSGTLTVEQGVVTTNQAGEALERIIEMAERVDRMITQIAIAASQQAASADQSSSSLHSIHNLSSENLTEMATTTAGIESLRATAAALERQVDRFRIHAPQPTFEARRASPARRALPHHTIAEPAQLP
jgi:methyl-accepting chemotaxis protein